MKEKIIKDLDDPRMYKPFVKEVKRAMTFANKYYFGGRVHIAETFRTPERQAELYENKKIIAAPSGFSMHQYGCAVDFWIEDLYGKYSNNVEDYRRLTELMSFFGLNYLRSADLVHFEQPTTINLETWVNAYMPLTHEKMIKEFHAALDREWAIYELYKRQECLI